MRKFVTSILLLTSVLATGQTDVSLFWKKDSVQIAEVISADPVQYKTVGHHGPAVENQYMALRLYFNNSGAIDVYSKANTGLELQKYHWYPSNEEIEAGAGCDEYRVGKTIGLGGISLWDGEKEVKLKAKSREARVEKTKDGALMEMISRGVAYMGDSVDIAVTVRVSDDSRLAIVEARCLSGQKVRFLTGVNFHEGQTISFTDDRIGVYGIHPADVVEHPLPIGAGMIFSKEWTAPEKTADLLRIVSKKPTKKCTTRIVATCSREKQINNEKAFFEYLKTLK